MIPMIAGLGDLPALQNEVAAAAKSKSLFDAVEADLDVTESLIYAGAITVSEVRSTVVQAQNNINQQSAAGLISYAQKQFRLSELSTQVDNLTALDQASPMPVTLWPDVRKAVEDAYQWQTADTAETQSDAAAAKANADTANNLFGGLGADLQNVIKWGAIGALAIGGIMVLPQLIASVQQLMRSRRGT